LSVQGCEVRCSFRRFERDLQCAIETVDAEGLSVCALDKRLSTDLEAALDRDVNGAETPRAVFARRDADDTGRVLRRGATILESDDEHAPAAERSQGVGRTAINRARALVTLGSAAEKLEASAVQLVAMNHDYASARVRARECRAHGRKDAGRGRRLAVY